MSGDWVGTLTTVIGAVGGALGAAGGLGVLFSRKKLKAETANVLTATAMTLVNELEDQAGKARVEAAEARVEASRARSDVTAARVDMARAIDEASEIRATLTDVLAMMTRWRNAVLNPRVSREELQVMVRTGPGRD